MAHAPTGAAAWVPPRSYWQGEEVEAAVGGDGGASEQTGGLGVGHKQKLEMAKDTDKAAPGGDVERVVRAVAGKGLAEQGHAGRVKGAQGLLELEQVRALVFGEAKTQQGVLLLARSGRGVVDIERD